MSVADAGSIVAFWRDAGYERWFERDDAFDAELAGELGDLGPGGEAGGNGGRDDRGGDRGGRDRGGRGGDRGRSGGGRRHR